MTSLADVLDLPAYAAVRDLPDGRRLAVTPMLFGVGRLIVSASADAVCYEDGWCFPTVARAVAAMHTWDGEGEPTGWHRHPASGRRRPDGDPAGEYVRS